MIDFPKATYVHRRIPKEAFYNHLDLTTKQKEKFISDVDRLFVENSLSNNTLNFDTKSDITEILLMMITLKTAEFDGKVVEAIARQNPHKLVFLLAYEDKRQLAVYQGKLYRTQWAAEPDVNLVVVGNSIDAVWDSIIEQIALQTERAEKTDDLSVTERLQLQERILKLEKLIEKTEAAAWSAKQPKKRFELHTKLTGYKKALEELKNGKA